MTGYVNVLASVRLFPSCQACSDKFQCISAGTRSTANTLILISLIAHTVSQQSKMISHTYGHRPMSVRNTGGDRRPPVFLKLKLAQRPLCKLVSTPESSPGGAGQSASSSMPARCPPGLARGDPRRFLGPLKRRRTTGHGSGAPLLATE